MVLRKDPFSLVSLVTRKNWAWCPSSAFGDFLYSDSMWITIINPVWRVNQEEYPKPKNKKSCSTQFVSTIIWWWRRRWWWYNIHSPYMSDRSCYFVCCGYYHVLLLRVTPNARIHKAVPISHRRITITTAKMPPIIFFHPPMSPWKVSMIISFYSDWEQENSVTSLKPSMPVVQQVQQQQAVAPTLLIHKALWFWNVSNPYRNARYDEKLWFYSMLPNCPIWHAFWHSSCPIPVVVEVVAAATPTTTRRQSPVLCQRWSCNMLDPIVDG